MPTVTVETGAIVVGANSFITSDDVVTYATNRGLIFTTDDQDKADAAVIEGGDYLRNEMRYTYRGSRITYDQTMPWPRIGASEYRGPAIPSNVVPWRVKDAQCQLTIRAFASPGTLQRDLDRGGKVKTEKVDVLETTYADNAPIETLIVAVQGLLQPLLLAQNVLPALPYQAPPDEPDAFVENAFSDPVGASDTNPLTDTT